MKLEFLDDISDGGKFTAIVTNQLIRLYDFDKLQADELRQAIQQTIIERKEALDLSKLECMEEINCTLTLLIGNTDTGITRSDKSNFNCVLTIGAYEHMVDLLEPFCKEDCSGFQWLYEIDTPIEFLFSPSGSW